MVRSQEYCVKEAPSYIIGTGWWCDVNERANNLQRKFQGSDEIREVAFFDEWHGAIMNFSSPREIVVIDSNAPLKPDLRLRSTIRWIELPFNAGHCADSSSKFCGWTRSFIMSATYALMSDVDYFVYLEQDCVIFGNGVIERCINEMERSYMFGSGQRTPQPIQQSMVVIKTTDLPIFLQNLHAIRPADADLFPEWKFCFATSKFLSALANWNIGVAKWVHSLYRILGMKNYCFLPIGHGRERPIDFKSRHFYFQHGSEIELNNYRDLCSGDRQAFEPDSDRSVKTAP